MAEFDPDAPTAIIDAGDLVSQANATGVGTTTLISVADASDDPADPTNLNPDGDNDPDDPNRVRHADHFIDKIDRRSSGCRDEWSRRELWT